MVHAKNQRRKDEKEALLTFGSSGVRKMVLGEIWKTGKQETGSFGSLGEFSEMRPWASLPDYRFILRRLGNRLVTGVCEKGAFQMKACRKTGSAGAPARNHVVDTTVRKRLFHIWLRPALHGLSQGGRGRPRSQPLRTPNARNSHPLSPTDYVRACSCAGSAPVP